MLLSQNVLLLCAYCALLMSWSSSGRVASLNSDILSSHWAWRMVSLSKGCFLQWATARLKEIDCNHWTLSQTNLPHQYGVGKAGGPKPYWDGNQWLPPSVILTKKTAGFKMSKGCFLQWATYSLAVAHCKKHHFDILKPAVGLTLASPVCFLLKPQVFH